MTQEALRMALDALEKNTKHLPVHFDCHFEAITAIKEALAQEQEPVKYSDYEPDGVHHNKLKQDTIQRLSALVRTQQITIDKLEAQTQEPVAWMDADGNVSDNSDHNCFPIPLYTTPLQRTEQNFCSRCGKRTADLTVIHTCTPPQENT